MDCTTDEGTETKRCPFFARWMRRDTSEIKREKCKSCLRHAVSLEIASISTSATENDNPSSGNRTMSHLLPTENHAHPRWKNHRLRTCTSPTFTPPRPRTSLPPTNLAHPIPAPRSHAGHHTTQITTAVHVPFTCQANAASTSSCLIPTSGAPVLVTTPRAVITVGGATASRSSRCASVAVVLLLELASGRGTNGVAIVVGRTGATNMSGAASRPTSKPRLKFRVDSVAREMPRIRREKQEMSV